MKGGGGSGRRVRQERNGEVVKEEAGSEGRGR